MFDLFTGSPLSFNNIGWSTLDMYHLLSKELFLNVGLKYENSNRHWDRVEHCYIQGCDFPTEKFCKENQHLDQDIILSFGSPCPGSDEYLLHYAPGWDSNRNKMPVLLVPGAGLNATSFADLYGMGYKGILQQLVELDYRVFAITFSHPHGDNYIQAEQLAHAIERIKEVTGSPKADIVAHSKGGIASRLFLSGMGKTPYKGQVRRFIMLGVPNLGTDFSFRQPLINYLIYISGSNGVVSWDKIMLLGNMVDISERSIYGDGCFPGQSQLLYRWDDVYELDMLQQDWWTTYYGGQGFISNSRGIDVAIQEGGSLIEKLEKKGLEPEIEFAVLAGDNHYFNALPGEATGVSDGLIFAESALNTAGMAKRGSILINKEVFHVNHMEFLYNSRVGRWIDHQLRD
ncbi:MAG: esterase/lipase family protein [Syntrophomonadaceae bacterium]